MASIEFVDVRRGMVVKLDDGQLYQCLDRDLNTPGNWRAILQLKLRNLKTGSIAMQRVRPQDKVEVAYLDKRDFAYSYKDGTDYVFMDSETFEQVTLSAEIIGDQMKYLKENDVVQITMYEGKPMDVEIPATVNLKVVESEPALKGATAAAQYKPATLETGLKITVPPFINIGEVVQIDTRTGEYLGRSK
ncbi:MAG TPA: elongation factor P [Gemmataceae bacterium]|jgi:elongation factor P|nr:elongation factor P [Gemmataceae bacterium]